MKSRKLLVVLITALICCNVISILFFTSMKMNHEKQITVMNNSSNLLQDEIGKVRVENFNLQNDIKKISEENEQTKQNNELLIKEISELKEEIEDLNANALLSDKIIKKYEVMAKSSSVTITEKETYINELNKRIEQLGGIDVFELPQRSKNYDGMTIWLEDGAHESYADIAINYIDKLPKSFIEEITQEGWTFIITTRNIENTYQSKTKNTIGLTIYSKKRIYVSNNEGYIASAVIHELGHALDYSNNYISFSDEWISIYNEERKQSGYAEYFINDSREYFAESVQQYYTYKEMVRKKTPKTYEFIKNLVKAYENE